MNEPAKMSNREIAALFDRMAQMLAIRGDVVDRVLAYQRAAGSIGELSQSLEKLRAEGALTTIPHIGNTLAEKIEEMLTRGRLQFYEKLAREIPRHCDSDYYRKKQSQHHQVFSKRGLLQ